MHTAHVIVRAYLGVEIEVRVSKESSRIPRLETRGIVETDNREHFSPYELGGRHFALSHWGVSH